MSLRQQLIVVSLFALFLPWAAYTYIQEMETVLRDGQQQALLATAASVAQLINSRPDMLEELRNTDTTTSDSHPLYLHESEAAMLVDGYRDDWLRPVYGFGSFVEAGNADAPLTVEYVGLFVQANAYLYFRVEDAETVFHNPARGGIANGDHIQLVLQHPDGRVFRYWLAAEAPGSLIARTRLNGRIVTEPRIRGAWRDTETGYQVELGMPADWLGARLGFSVVDGGDARRWTGSMQPGSTPGLLVRKSTGLDRLLATFSRDTLRFSVVDSAHWIKASSGELRFEVVDDARRPAGTWLLEAVYRWIMAGGSDDPALIPAEKGKLLRPEIAAALTGSETSRWYRVDTEPGKSIISAATAVEADGRVVGAVVAEQGSEQLLALSKGAVTRLLLLTVVATLLIGMGLVLYASFLSFRIGRLNHQVSNVMSQDGRLSEFPARWAGDEIGDLGRAFAQLLRRMREYTDYLRGMSGKLSHELRTPLTVVRTSLDNLEHEPLSGQAAVYIERARSSAGQLNHILTAMSEASRVEESIKAAEKETLLLSDFLAAVVAAYRSAYPDLDILLRLPTDQLHIQGSPELLVQMLDKLMDNAADFVTADGCIEFALTPQDGQVLITVGNDGPLLPQSMSEELFESMVSLRSGKQEQAHLGLGLTIVRLVAEFHGGRVSANNRGDGSGVCFNVMLPLVS